MRFAYMDEKGRQVHVASVGDLERRIQAGEINEDTELYDALDDRWAPAREHPAYVAARDAAPKSGATPSDPPSAPPGSTTPARGPSPAGLPPAPPGRNSSVATSDDEAALERDWSTALKDEFLGAVPSGGTESGSVGPAMPSGPAGADAPRPDATSRTPPSRSSGDMEPIDGASNVFGGFDDVVGGSGDEPDAFDATPPALSGDGDLQFEQFMPKPQAAPVQGTQPGRGSAGSPHPGPVGPDSVSASQEEDFFLIDDSSLGNEPEAESSARNTPARRKPNRAFVPGVAGVAIFVLLMAVAVPRLARLGTSLWNEGAENVETVPEDGAELSEQVRTEAFFLAARAQAATFQALEGVRRNLGVESVPPSAWMEGIYFAHASRYPAAQSYWERYRSYLLYARRELPALFESSFRREVAASAIALESREAVTELVLSDFQQRVPAMSRSFDDFVDLADAALALHEFLVLKEDEIEYAPFTRSGVSRDPIVEAVPATEQTRADFWQRLEGVTARLETLGALDRVTTTRLQEKLVDRLEAIGY